MPIIQFTKADVLRSSLLDNEKWYSWQVVKVEGPKENSKKDGFNFEVTCSLIDQGPDLDGKEIKKVYSNKAISMMIPLVAACQGKTLADFNKDAFQLDTDDIMNCKFDGKSIVSTYEGQLKNEIAEFMPYKSAAGKAPGF